MDNKDNETKVETLDKDNAEIIEMGFGTKGDAPLTSAEIEKLMNEEA